MAGTVHTASSLRLMSDLKAIRQEPPEVCARSLVYSRFSPASGLRFAQLCQPLHVSQGVSASPQSDENLYVWSATIFGPDETPWEGR
eukprot:8284973-Pyramimonas_sp.AAC.1